MSAPIAMTLHEGKDGLDIAETEYDGQFFTASSRNGVTMKLARMLVEACAPDAPVGACGRDERLQFTSPSLHRLARWTVEESDRGIRQRRWKPSPMDGGEVQDARRPSIFRRDTTGAEAP